MSARRRFPVTAYDQINLTNLIDTLFFLLIIFMITAPLLEYSVNVNPPEMNADAIAQDSSLDVSVVINVGEDGTITLDKVIVGDEMLRFRLDEIAKERGTDIPVYLRGDKNLSYGGLVDVMKIVRDAGFRNVNLLMVEDKSK